jgi:hypothetical protein
MGEARNAIAPFSPSLIIHEKHGEGEKINESGGPKRALRPSFSENPEERWF